MTVIIRTKTTGSDHHSPRVSLWRRIARSFALRKERQHLLALEDHLLDDIGVTRAQALTEGQKASWNAPHYWHN